MTHLDIFTVDPAGSDDADDGFSLELLLDGSMRLHVHVCDPTARFEPWDRTFLSAVENGTSFYPSGRRSRRMFSRPFAGEVSLTCGERLAVTTTFAFSSIRRLMAHEIRLSRVRCDPRHRMDHAEAARRIAAGDPTLTRCRDLALELQRQLGQGPGGRGLVHFTSLGYLRLAYPKVHGTEDRVVLLTDPPGVVEVKEMVSRMSVATNGVVANLLLRADAGDAARGVSDRFVTRTHLPYTQFTSPLRRVGDCVVHFEVKRLVLGCRGLVLSEATVDEMVAMDGRPERVFSDDSIERLWKATDAASRQRRELQQINVKFRFLQYIHQTLQDPAVPSVALRVAPHRMARTSASLFIDRIGEHHTHFLYHVYSPTGGIRPVSLWLERMFERHGEDGAHFDLEVTRCAISTNQYHNHTLPEIDELFEKAVRPRPTRSVSAPP